MLPATPLNLLVRALGVAACVLSFCQFAPAADDSFEQTVRPLLAKFCFACHDAKKKEGELDLSRFNNQTEAAAGDVWETVAARLYAVEMPPNDSPQPNDEQRQKLVRWLEKVNAGKTSDCQKLASDQTQRFYRGYVMSRRLTRSEYDNTVRDLTGLDLKPSTLLPNDGSGGEGFDTNGDTLFLSPIHLEKYLAAAEMVFDTLFPTTREQLPPHLVEARARLMPAQPTAELAPRGAARKNLAAFAARAFRREVTEAQVERLLTMFDRAQQRGDSFEASLKLAFKAVLISPNFLFLAETEPTKPGVYQLGDYELASRLSYFLWASMPDDELLAVAKAGGLHEPQVLQQQTQRLLKSPKSKGLAESFMRQWLGIESLGTTVKPDARRFPEFGDELADAMRAETTLLLDHILREDRSLLELINADYTFLNERLARHYGIPNVTGDQMQLVKLSDRNRGGVLALGSVLVNTSYPLRTSPVLRGRWVLEQVFGSKVAPPPPNVPELPKDDAQPGQLSLRAQLEKHRSDPACASCHGRMDPLGFGLENFDSLGRWRTNYAVLEGDALKPTGVTIDASGNLASGEKFTGPAELKTLVLARQDEVLRNIVRKMLGYALGRSLNRFDQCVVDETLKAVTADGCRSSVLIQKIVASYPFQYRYCKK